MILIFKYILPKKYVGLTLWPIIILRDEELRKDPVLMNHEKIHLKQQLELLILPFYIFYFLEWTFKIVKYRSLYKAYKNISFEREAYANEQQMNYLDQRPFWNSFSYLFNRL